MSVFRLVQVQTKATLQLNKGLKLLSMHLIRCVFHNALLTELIENSRHSGEKKLRRISNLPGCTHNATHREKKLAEATQPLLWRGVAAQFTGPRARAPHSNARLACLSPRAVYFAVHRYRV